MEAGRNGNMASATSVNDSPAWRRSAHATAATEGTKPAETAQADATRRPPEFHAEEERADKYEKPRIAKEAGGIGLVVKEEPSAAGF